MEISSHCSILGVPGDLIQSINSTVAATLTAVKTVTDLSGTTTVVVNGKRDILDIPDLETRELDDRSLADFAALASLFGLKLTSPAVSSACSCLTSDYTAPAVTSTVMAQKTVTVATAKATAAVTTTVKGVTV